MSKNPNDKVPMKVEPEALPSLEGKIISLRGDAVILAQDLAKFYGVKTGDVNQYRSRNSERFEGFAFELSDAEEAELRSQNVISGRVKYTPWAFTEHGVAMISMGMKSDRAQSLSRIIIDTFVNHRRGTLPAERALPTADSDNRLRKLQTLILDQIEGLLETRIKASGETIGEQLGTIGQSAIDHVKALLETKGLQNEKVSAEIAKIIAESEAIYASAKKTNAEAESVELQNMKLRLEMIREFRTMLLQLQRDGWLDTFDQGFGLAILAGDHKKQIEN